MFLGVSFPSVFGVVSGLGGVAASCVSVMGCFFVHPALMMLGRFGMMPRGVGVMFRRLFMVFGCFL